MKTVEQKTGAETVAARYYAATLAITGLCDLRCPYCYQNDLSDHNEIFRPFAGVMDERTVTLARDYIDDCMSKAGLDKLALVFFGGEPLLHSEVMESLLTKLDGRKLCSCTVITNGTHMTPPIMRRLCDLGLRTAQISLDGGPHTHDLTRHNASGRGSYDLIMHNVKACSVLEPLSPVFRINVTDSNIDDVPGAIDDLADRCDASDTMIDIRRVTDTGKYWHTTGLDESVAQRFANLYRHALERGFIVRSPRDWEDCVTCGHEANPYGCAIGPDGSLYSCLESIGRNDLAVGDVSHGYDGNLVPQRWRHCGFTSTTNTTSSFRDTVDGLVLDMLRERGLLGKSDDRVYAGLH